MGKKVNQVGKKVNQVGKYTPETRIKSGQKSATLYTL
jgi:hypothetical protein